MVLIYDNGVYWRAEGKGVTSDRAKAHRYTRDRAFALVGDIEHIEIIGIGEIAGAMGEGRLAEIERQNADLQAANNGLLERARKAEAEAVKQADLAEKWRELRGLNAYAAECRANADQWYYDIETGERIKHNPGERMMLIVSEIVEAFEGIRKNKMDDHLPHRKSVEVEMVDALIRIFDFAGENGLDLDGAYAEKTVFNAAREDHKPEARRAAGGKKF